MSAATRLAQSIAGLVFANFDAGNAFLRVPEVVTPMPVAELLTLLSKHPGVRVALFLDSGSDAYDPDVAYTRDVATAIDWRNDGTIKEPLLVIGNVQRNRAKGLAQLKLVKLEEIRRRLFTDIAQEMKNKAVPQPAIRLINTCAELRLLTDLAACAEYCESLLPIDGTSAARARNELWRLGFLPDPHDKEIDQRRLAQNAELVSRLRSMDASTRQKLIRHVATTAGKAAASNYTPLKKFATTGEVAHLAQLTFEGVAKAVRATQAKGPLPEDSETEATSSVTASAIAVIRDPEFDEEGFLAQVRDSASSEDDPITVGGVRITDWDHENLESVEPLFSDPDAGSGYAGQAGSIEEIPDDEPFPQPGKGKVDWRSLHATADKVRKLERERAGRPDSPCADLVELLIELRDRLEPFRTSIPNEGVRLFMASGQLRSVAEQLVETWVSLWRQLDELRTALPANDHVHVRRLAEQLASTDLRVTVYRGDVDAYVLPLHPLVLEPRVRAAELFLEADDESDGMFALVAGSLDPSMPSISILRGGGPVSLGYAGVHKGLLHYSKEPRQIDSADVLQTLRQLILRFTNVHPYGKLSLSVGILDPPVKTAKGLLRWLGAENVAARVALHVFTTRGNQEDLRSALDEAKEELVSGDISSSRFAFDVIEIASLGSIVDQLSDSELVPHLMFLFDVGEIEHSSQGASFGVPPLGSLISEWVFDTDPLEDSRPVIRPRSGSNLLTQYIEAQAGLFEIALPSQQRSPLLSAEASETLENLAKLTTWVVLCEGVSSLVPPLELGNLHLIGRMLSGSHIAFVYSTQVSLLLEPVLSYLQQSTWIDPDAETAVRFLLGTIRMALPEGLLGFFKSRGVLSKESVLGRLGLAAAVAYLNASPTEQLVVSLDTEGARRWLGLREGVERRADLIVLRHEDSQWVAEAVEVKARSEATSWGATPPESVRAALTQVREMERLLKQVFGIADPEPFTPSRKEILKRQVFLEALQQWEGFRFSDESIYRRRLDELNQIFAGEVPLEIRSRIFLVDSSQSAREEHRTAADGDGHVDVVLLGVPWLQSALQEQPGASLDIPLSVLDELGLDLDDVSEGEPPDGGPEGQRGTEVAVSEPGPGEIAIPPSGDGSALGAAALAEAHELAVQLRSAFIARKAPFKGIATEDIVVGPTVVQIPFSVPAGAKLAAIQSQEEDLARDLGVQSVRLANWPGHPGYAIAELPRRTRSISDVASLAPRATASEYPEVALGAGVDFSPLWVPLDELPHLLVAGTTGSGKSVFLRSFLWQLTNFYSPDALDLVLIDAKGMADYLDFSEAPQFKTNADFHSGVTGALELLEDIVETRLPARTTAFRDYAKAALRREPAVQVTNLRQLLADARSVEGDTPVRPLVVVVDEFAELVLGSADRKRFETLVTRFVQVARAIGGHLVAATQRPSTDVVPGVMKGNFARVALRVQQSVDSRVILDENGAETLLGRGDLLFKSADVGLVRLQGYSAIGPYHFSGQ